MIFLSWEKLFWEDHAIL